MFSAVLMLWLIYHTTTSGNKHLMNEKKMKKVGSSKKGTFLIQGKRAGA